MYYLFIHVSHFPVISDITILLLSFVSAMLATSDTVDFSNNIFALQNQHLVRHPSDSIRLTGSFHRCHPFVH